jgi:hypothetical protein
MKPKNTNPAAIPQSTRRPKFRKFFIILALVIIAIAGAAAFFYHRHQAQEQAYQADKARFAKVETDMKTAYDAMVSAAGVPDVSSSSKNCGRPNLKYAEGHLSCDITYTFAYAENSLDTAYLHTKNAQDALVNTEKFKLVSTATAEDINSSKKQALSIGFMNEQGITCNLEFNFNKPQFYEGYKDIKTIYFSLYQFRCIKDEDEALF